MNKAKAKGTAWETAIVRYLREHGHPFAERRALAGSQDKGDIALPGVVIEAKDCKQFALAKWVDEAGVEAVNAGVDIGIVWLKRPRFTDPGDAYVLMNGATFMRLLGD